MSLIKEAQRTFLFDEAAQYALKQYDFVLLGDYLEKVLNDPDYKDKLKKAQPLTSLYEALPNAEINVPSIKSVLENMIRDIEILGSALDKIDNIALNFLNTNGLEIQLLKKLSTAVKTQAESEKLRLAEKANWSFVETFNTTNQIDLSLTTASIDTAEGVVYPNTLVGEIPLTLESESVLDSGGSLKSSASEMLDRSSKTAWVVYCTTPNVAARAKLNLPKSDLTGITIDPIGFGITIKLTFIGSDDTYEVTETIYSTKTIRLSTPNITSIVLEFSSPSSTLPKACGIREIKVMGNSSELEGSIYTKAFSLTTFNELKVTSIQSTPPNTNINWYWSYDQSTWNKFTPNQWFSVTSQGSVKEIIEPSTLAQDGILYRPTTFALAPFNLSSGRLEVGENQFEVTAQRKNLFAEGVMNYPPSPTEFTPGLKTWANADVSVGVQPATSIQSEVQLAGSSIDHPYFQAGVGLVANLPTNSGNSLVWLPISGSRPSFQKNYHYRFKVKVFCKNDVLINTGRYWFLQGFKAAGTKTFREARFSLGSFSMWINGLAVCGDTYPDTLYDDGSADSRAINGNGFTFALTKGWNEIEYHIYRPEIPSYLKDADLVEEFLQLVIYPNIFDSTFKDTYGITKVLGSGEFPSSSQFDLVWKKPKELIHWAWSEFLTGTMVFNTNKTHKIDGFYGGTLAQSYPNLNLFYKSASSISSLSLYLRADLQKMNEGDARPTISQYEAMTR